MNPSVSPRRRILALCAIACLILLLMLPNLIWLRFDSGFGVWITALIVPMALLLLLFAILGDWPWLACLLLTPFAALAPLEAFYVETYHHPSYPEILATIVASNSRETREYLGDALLPLMLCVAVGLLLSLLAAWLSRTSRLHWRHDSRAWLLTILISVPFATGIVTAITSTEGIGARLHASVQMIASLANPIKNGFPFGMIGRITAYRSQWAAMRTESSRLDGFRFHASRSATINKRQVYVLVIGEASRRDHWQIFGYGRATNPELTTVRNLVPITDMVSSWPESITAIPMLVTRKPPAETALTWKEPSVLRAMQEAGFDTYWISDQMAIGDFDSPVSIYAYEAKHVEFLNHASWTTAGSYDEDLLQPLQDALNDSNNDLFIVLHMMGSHQHYDFRYPETYRYFRPTQSDPVDDVAHRDHVRNSYDNTIRYSDHVLASIIGILQDSGNISALWFVSDHGETLPTESCSLSGHGFGTRFDFQVPALFWYSNAYAAMFPARLAEIRNNAKKRSMSADTFETLIDMSNVKFPGRDPTWSLFSPQWRYRSRIVNGYWQSNIDTAAFGKGCEIVLPSNG